MPSSEGFGVSEELAQRSAGDAVESRPPGVAGGRGPAVVARRMSLQGKLQNALALGVVALVGGGFLAWYYAGLAESRAEAKQAVKPAQVQGEMKLPPLAPAPKVVKPAESVPLVEDGSAEAEALLAGSPVGGAQYAAADPARTMVAGYSTTPPVDPVLQRRLEAPVLVRGVGGHGVAAEEEVDARPASGLDAAEPRPPSGGARGDAGAGAAGSGELAERLRPTVLAATVAGVLPERGFLLPKGAVIDCTLETAIDSTLPGMTTCVTATDVWSADGSVVLLERGTRLVGETRGGVAQGMRRLFVLWSEARTPAGIVVPLASPGTDALGRSGVTGEVDTRFGARFGAAILISLIDAAAAAVVAAQNSGGDSVIVSSQGASDVMSEVLRSTINIPPTIRVEQGARVSVLVARDADFASVYALAKR
jgi:type IV secretion system protein VirB10